MFLFPFTSMISILRNLIGTAVSYFSAIIMAIVPIINRTVSSVVFVLVCTALISGGVVSALRMGIVAAANIAVSKV